MAVPKRRVSKSRKGMRRSHESLKAKSSSNCSNCGNATLPHRICIHCGYYAGQEIVSVQE